jgi:hypothetical protein
MNKDGEEEGSEEGREGGREGGRGWARAFSLSPPVPPSRTRVCIHVPRTTCVDSGSQVSERVCVCVCVCVSWSCVRTRRDSTC